MDPSQTLVSPSPAAPGPGAVPTSRLRLAVAALGCVAAGLSFVGFMTDGGAPWVLGLPTLLLFGAAGLLYRAHLPSQLLVRAALWSNLILGTILATSGNGDESGLGALMAAGTAMGLVSLGRHGLDMESGDFAPVAFRGSLVLTLVMALADLQSLALFGALGMEDSAAKGGPMLACAAVMGVALLGLYRLKIWGLVLNIAANVGVAGMAVTGVLDLPKPIVFALCATALVQLALPIPLVVAVVRGRPPGARRGALESARAVLVPAVSVAMASLAVLGWAAGSCLTHF